MSAFPDTFFEALADEGSDAAMHALRDAAFESGLEHEPSPRAQPFFSEGEWELSKTLVPLTLVEPDACFGLMPAISTPRGTVYTRFCGKSKFICDARSHQTSKLKADMQTPGWYLAGGTSVRQGSIWEIRFPRFDDGGPFSVQAGLHLLDPDRPFRMSFGQWLFLHSEWTAQRVESLASEDSSESPRSLEVTTDSPDVAPSPVIGAVDRVETPSDASPPVPRGGVDAQDYTRQTRRLANLEATVTTLRDELQSSREATQKAVSAYEEQELTLASLMGRLGTAERLLNKTVEAFKNSGAPSKSFVTSVEHALFNPQGELGAIKSQLKSLQTRFDSDGAIECHGVYFASKMEMASWFEKNGLTIGVFCDAVTLLHTIQAPVIHQAEATKAMEAQQKVSMTTDLEAAIITSFSTILPSILVGNKKEGTGGTFDWLKSYLKTYTVWDPAGRKSGVSSRIKEGIKVAARRAEGLLSMTTDDSEAVKVASGLLSDSSTFITSLCTWIESAHRELTEDTPYTSEEVWDMQLECLEQIFEELHQARVAVVDAARISQGIYLWGMLHAWQIQQRYVSNDFQDDPALTGIFVRRVLLHGQDVSLDARLNKITDGLRKAEEQDRQVQSDLKHLQRDTKELKTTVREIKAKLN